MTSILSTVVESQRENRHDFEGSRSRGRKGSLWPYLCLHQQPPRSGRRLHGVSRSLVLPPRPRRPVPHQIDIHHDFRSAAKPRCRNSKLSSTSYKRTTSSLITPQPTSHWLLCDAECLIEFREAWWNVGPSALSDVQPGFPSRPCVGSPRLTPPGEVPPVTL